MKINYTMMCEGMFIVMQINVAKTMEAKTFNCWRGNSK